LTILILSKATFARFDRDRGGTIDARELNEAVNSYGYNLTPQTLHTIVKRYASQTNAIVFDDFVALSIRLRGISAGFVHKMTFLLHACPFIKFYWRFLLSAAYNFFSFSIIILFCYYFS
jgi:hypothetical protein